LPTLIWRFRHSSISTFNAAMDFDGSRPPARHMINLTWLHRCLAAVGSGFVSVAGLYIGFFFLLVPSVDVPSTYKWLLLRTVPSPRLIIESGSNGHHAINAAALTKKFGVTTINIADNAGYAFVDRVTRLQTYARRGDTILLPLEWIAYQEPLGIRGAYESQVFELIQDYFWVVPLERKIQLIFQLPLAQSIEVLDQNVRLLLSPSASRKRVRERIQQLFGAASLSADGGFASERSRGLLENQRQTTCEASLVGSIVGGSAVISPKFLQALDRLDELQKKGIRIIFTWPTVVGDGCYDHIGKVRAFAETISAEVVRRGMTVIGDPMDYALPMEFIDNTYSHVVTAGQTIVTERVIRNLESIGMSSGDSVGRINDLRRFVDQKISEIENNARAFDVWPSENAKSDSVLTPSDKILFLKAGWWDSERTGVWSYGNVAFVRINGPTPPFRLGILGRPFQSKRSLVVSVNGVDVGTRKISPDMGWHHFDVPNVNGKCCEIELSLDDAPPASPKSLGISEDSRTLGFFLGAIVFENERSPNEMGERR
jgi:hypothetical protein